jgi:hypothetical protein
MSMFDLSVIRRYVIEGAEIIRSSGLWPRGIWFLAGHRNNPRKTLADFTDGYVNRMVEAGPGNLTNGRLGCI